MSDYKEKLTELGWRCQLTPHSPSTEYWYKRFPNATRCACNDSKEGIQVGIKAYPKFDDFDISFEMEIVGELASGDWVNLSIYSIRGEHDLIYCLDRRCERLVKIWNLAAE